MKMYGRLKTTVAYIFLGPTMGQRTQGNDRTKKEVARYAGLPINLTVAFSHLHTVMTNGLGSLNKIK